MNSKDISLKGLELMCPLIFDRHRKCTCKNKHTYESYIKQFLADKLTELGKKSMIMFPNKRSKSDGYKIVLWSDIIKAFTGDDKK